MWKWLTSVFTVIGGNTAVSQNLYFTFSRLLTPRKCTEISAGVRFGSRMPITLPRWTAALRIGLDFRTVAEFPTTAKEAVSCEDNQVRFVRLWFTDMLGQLKSFSINAADLDDAFEGGMGFDGSSITGFNLIEESDMIAMPDPTTMRLIPWRPEDGNRTARMFADIKVPGGEPYEGDRAGSCAGPWSERGRWVRRLLHRPRARVLLPAPPSPRTARPKSSTRVATSTSPRSTRGRRPPRDRARPRAAGDPRRVHPPRGRPLPA